MPLPKNLNPLVQQVCNSKLPMNKRWEALNKLKGLVNINLEESEARLNANIFNFETQWAEFLKRQNALDKGFQRILGPGPSDAEIDKVMSEMTAEVEKDKANKAAAQLSDKDILERMARLQDVSPQQIQQNIQQIAKEGMSKLSRPPKVGKSYSAQELHKQTKAKWEENLEQLNESGLLKPLEKESFIETLVKGFKNLFNNIQKFFGGGTQQATRATKASPRQQELPQSKMLKEKATLANTTNQQSKTASDPDLLSDRASVQKKFMSLCNERDRLDKNPELVKQEKKELGDNLSPLDESSRPSNP